MTVSKRPTTPKTAPPDEAHHPNSSIARKKVVIEIKYGNAKTGSNSIVNLFVPTLGGSLSQKFAESNSTKIGLLM
jgi:hypothetical protein